jgi:hypothetical protein
MRQLNVHYARGLREPALDAYWDIAGVQTIGHRPHRRGFETITADQACQGTLSPRGGQIRHLNSRLPKFRKINNN